MKQILGVLFLLACFAFILYDNGPHFIADARGSGWRPALELRAAPGARCTTHSFVVTSCDIGWESVVTNEKGKDSYMVLGPTGSVPLRFLRAADGHVTLAWGLDHMMWRGITLVFWIGVAVLFVIGALRANVSEEDAPARAPQNPMPQNPAPQTPAPRAPTGPAPKPAGFGRR